MTEESTEKRSRWLAHPAMSGIVGSLIAAVATIIGAFIGNTGAVSGVLPGNPTVTVSTTVTPPAATVSVPGPTVTITQTSDPPPTSSPSTSEVHLADQSALPEDLVADLSMNTKSNLKVDGKTFDFGWTAYDCGSCNPHVVASLNLNQAYERFSARIGLDGTSDNSTGKIEVIGDGKTLWAKSLSLSTSYDVELPVEGVQRLEIRELQPSDDIIYALGDPRLQ